jgi:hypothetical protein
VVYRCNQTTTRDAFVTMNAIMHYQEEFFDGDETKLK